MTLPKPECELGYTAAQVREILGAASPAFAAWMQHQTTAMCEGRRFNHEIKSYEPACGGVAHGIVVYPRDLRRFLEGLPNDD